MRTDQIQGKEGSQMWERQTQVVPLGDSSLRALVYRTLYPLSVWVVGAYPGGMDCGIMFSRGVAPGGNGEKAWM